MIQGFHHRGTEVTEESELEKIGGLFRLLKSKQPEQTASPQPLRGMKSTEKSGEDTVHHRITEGTEKTSAALRAKYKKTVTIK